MTHPSEHEEQEVAVVITGLDVPFMDILHFALYWVVACILISIPIAVFLGLLFMLLFGMAFTDRPRP